MRVGGTAAGDWGELEEAVVGHWGAGTARAGTGAPLAGAGAAGGDGGAMGGGDGGVGGGCGGTEGGDGGEGQLSSDSVARHARISLAMPMQSPQAVAIE